MAALLLGLGALAVSNVGALWLVPIVVTILVVAERIGGVRSRELAIYAGVSFAHSWPSVSSTGRAFLLSGYLSR